MRKSKSTTQPEAERDVLKIILETEPPEKYDMKLSEWTLIYKKQIAENTDWQGAVFTGIVDGFTFGYAAGVQAERDRVRNLWPQPHTQSKYN